MTRRQLRAAAQKLSNYKLGCELERLAADIEDEKELLQDWALLCEASFRIINGIATLPWQEIEKLIRQRDEAREIAMQLRNDAERPGGGRRVLPWEKKQ